MRLFDRLRDGAFATQELYRKDNGSGHAPAELRSPAPGLEAVMHFRSHNDGQEG